MFSFIKLILVVHYIIGVFLVSKISVIIPTYKRSSWLDRAIKSVLNQTYKNVEVVVVDDNPPDSKYRRILLI